MLQQVLTDLKLYKHRFLLQPAALLLMFLFGMLLVGLIMSIDGGAENWVCLGTLSSMVMLVVLGLIQGHSFRQDFMLALSMGRTRREFMLSFFLRMVLQLAIGYGIVWLLYQMEQTLYAQWYAHAVELFSLTFLNEWWVAAVMLLGVSLVSVFTGTLYSRFGKPVTVVMYFVWLFSCMILPRMFEEKPLTDKSIDQTAYGLRTLSLAVPTEAWIVLGTAAVIAMIVTAIRLGFKQSVK